MRLLLVHGMACTPLSETLLSQDDTPVLVDARHTFIMNHPDVRRAIRQALGTNSPVTARG